ncbi:MAG: class I SAM-dependent methyltransferase [Candidatus Riflebacteria bacterium]|nr:class I SAM-dependent methyltransferase [Candidatus Riflebacteria bacterium]
METITSELRRYFKKTTSSGIFLTDHLAGYWSNLSKIENTRLINLLKTSSSLNLIRELYPYLEEVIYSPKRTAGLELLDIKGSESCIDYGCMWGALSIPLAKRTNSVIGVDQTLESLEFLKSRSIEEKLDNIELICADLRRLPDFNLKFDIALVNGVLEWIPEEGIIELGSYYGNFQQKNYAENPGLQQKAFLEYVYNQLKTGGKIYLAIENRYDWKMFFGAKDPHANIAYTTIVHRSLANIISKWQLGRPYVNWIYSFSEIKKLLLETGFCKTELFAAFPDYRFPEKIIPFNKKYAHLIPVASKLRDSSGRIILMSVLSWLIKSFIFRNLRLISLSPSIIAIAHK